jgi:hypothetical protein
VLTRVYFRGKDLEGVTHKDTRAREMVEVCVEALYFGPLGPLYKTQVLQRNFLRRREGVVEALVSHMKGLETENQ